MYARKYALYITIQERLNASVTSQEIGRNNCFKEKWEYKMNNIRKKNIRCKRTFFFDLYYVYSYLSWEINMIHIFQDRFSLVHASCVVDDDSAVYISPVLIL